MIADDLFAGAGGWDLAAAKLGIHARGVENMKEARATRDAAGLTTIHDDVWTFAPDGQASGLIASPPCQTFSAAGKGAGRKALDDVLRGIRDGYVDDLDHLRFLGEEVGDDRTALVLTPLHFALTGGYEWLAWEQVPAVLPVWQACADYLSERGWNTWAGLLHAEQYGVPQTRKRAFLLASRRGPIAPPTPTHSRYYSRTPDKLDPGVQKWVSMAEALGWDGDGWALGTTNVRGGEYQSRPIAEPGPTITAAARSFRWGVPPFAVETPGVKGGNMQENRVTVDHRPDYLMPTNDRPNVAKRSPDHPAPTMAFGHERPRWCWDRPSTTVQGDARIWPPGHKVNADDRRRLGADAANDRYGDRAGTHAVRVTVHEAGVLQSFPADFPWQGAKGKQFLQCGNAVPPGLALHALGAAAGINAGEAAA